MMNHSCKEIRKALEWIFIGLVFIYLSGCSPTHHYKTLSFFFDGVPDPSKTALNQGVDTLSKKDSSSIAQNSKVKISEESIHPPYQNQECGSCHNSTQMGKLNRILPDMCYQCHEDFSKKYKVLHAPLYGGYCTACHDPHSSSHEKLLTRKGQQLCLYCHNITQVMKAEVHQDIKDANCTDCHNPHGGEDRYVLR